MVTDFVHILLIFLCFVHFFIIYSYNKKKHFFKSLNDPLFLPKKYLTSYLLIHTNSYLLIHIFIFTNTAAINTMNI